MDYTKNYTQKIFRLTAIVLTVCMLLCLGVWVVVSALFTTEPLLRIASWCLLSAPILIVGINKIVGAAREPLQKLSDVIVYVGHSERGGAPPDTDKIKFGREIVTALTLQIYDLARMNSQSAAIVKTSDGEQKIAALDSAKTIVDHIGLPIVGINSEQKITFMNRGACFYFSVDKEQVVGKSFYDIVKLSFQSGETFEAWLEQSQKNTVTSTRQWERVRTTDEKGSPLKQFDLVASYIKQNSTGTETILAIYDKSEAYNHDDQETGFVAMAVHELRTPLTVMKGYIEVFEEEAGPLLSPELNGFIQKLQASAEQLTAFVGNILNVARVEESQLTLTLQENNWQDILQSAIDDLDMRAKVQGKKIELQIASGLPKVAVDRISIHEVINNLVDNAIKYSGTSERILITSQLNSQGMVETSVQDFGIGIPAAVMPDLFQKFYRSHKSRVQVGGTGLGLYLCKALINAHGGNIWVRSKEREGSIFSFTIQQFDKIRHEQASGEDGIMRGAHGWIRNHSLNRQ